jgi:ABC-2 type transport system permease protein
VTPARLARLMAVTWWMHLKMLNRSVFDSVLQVVWPLFFATAALLIFRLSGDRHALAYAALGAGVMTIWTAISSSASGILQRERSLGTLELLVAAPAPFPVTVLAVTGAVTTVGVYGMVVTLLWARFAFGVRFGPVHLVPLALAVVVTVLAFATLGFLLSVTVVRYRAAWALGGALEYPVWLACGFLVPTALLPAWLRPVSWLLAPTWGMTAMRAAFDGATPWRDLALGTILCAADALAGVVLARAVLRSARHHATLTLT